MKYTSNKTLLYNVHCSVFTAHMDNQLFLRSIQLEKVPTINQHPFHLPFITHWKDIDFIAPVTCFVGENGSGKSTLLESLAYNLGFNLEGGSLNFNFTTFEEKTALDNYIRLVKSVKRPKNGYFLRSESFYNVATHIEELDNDPQGLGPKIIDGYGGISLHQQSHGEAFWSTVVNRFQKRGIYILDEPEAALSPLRQLALLRILDELVKGGSQIIMATHSPILMAYPQSQILQFGDYGIEEVALEDTEHYQVWFDFIHRRERLLRELL